MQSVHPVIVPAETTTTEHILVSLQGTVFDWTPMIDDVQDTVWSNFNILLVIFIVPCKDFVLFLKDQILRKFQNIEIFVIFNDFEKGMYSYCFQNWLQLKLVEKA